MSGGRRSLGAVAPAVATVAGATLFLPWLRTGTTHRSAFTVVSALRGAGLLTRGPARLFYAAIALLPGIVAAAWVLMVAGWRRGASVAAVLAGGLLLGCALLERHVARHRSTGAVVLAAAAGGMTVVVGLVAVVVELASCQREVVV